MIQFAEYVTIIYALEFNNTVIGEDMVTVFYYSQADPMMWLKGRQAPAVTELQAEPEIITGGAGSRRYRQNWRRGWSWDRRRSRSSERRMETLQ